MKKIWTDPVWSKVISTIICALLGVAYVWFLPNFGPTLMATSVPNWLVFLAFVPTLIYATLSRKKRVQPEVAVLNSDQWFEQIADKLSDCSSVRIYLRTFDHPDNFREEHRNALMKIMTAIKVKLQCNADVQIISYCPTEEKSGIDWLKAELKTDELGHVVKICKTQPVANSSSMYLFDDKFVIFNKKTNHSTTYHVENYSNSIIHELLRIGFKGIREESK